MKWILLLGKFSGPVAVVLTVAELALLGIKIRNELMKSRPIQIDLA